MTEEPWTPPYQAQIPHDEEDHFYATLRENPAPNHHTLTPGIKRIFAKVSTPCARCGDLPFIGSQARVWQEYVLCSDECYIHFMDAVIGNG